MVEEAPSRLPSEAVRQQSLADTVVDEENAVADEHSGFDLDACADEGVALNLAIGADAHSLLNLDERTDAGSCRPLRSREVGGR
jgi:hypothetical protein